MKNALRKKLISGFMALSLVVTTFAPAITAFGEGELEASLYEVMSETTDTAEVAVLSSSDGSNVEVVCATETDAEVEAEEGLEVLESYKISNEEAAPDETLFVKAEQDENVSLAPEESLSIYSVEEDKVEDVIIEDITEEDDPCEIESDVTGLALVKDSGYRRLNFELTPVDGSQADGEDNDGTKMVTLSGMMPKNASAEAIDVTDMYAAKANAGIATVGDAELASTGDAAQSENVVAAYNITIKNGEEEYQPGEERPVSVQIIDSRISADADLQLWHIKDDGTKEQITDFAVEDGKVSFSAVGFSVYEIVEGPEPYEFVEETATALSELVENTAFCFSVTRSGTENYFTNALNNNNAFIVTTAPSGASEWYFEKAGTTDYYIYTYVDGVKKYIKNTSGNLAGLVESNGTLFTISESDKVEGSFYFKVKTENKWLQYSGSGTGIRFYGDKNNAENSNIKVIYTSSITIPDNVYDLDGKTYGLSVFINEGLAHTFTPNKVKNTNDLATLDVKVKVNPLTRNNLSFILEDNEVYYWTFHSVEKDEYTLSTVVNGEVKYLKIDSGKLSMVDESEATSIKVVPGSGDFEGKVKLVAGTSAISYTNGNNNNKNQFTVISDSTSNEKAWFDLLSPNDLLDDDFVIYSAAKVSLGDREVVKNGSKVVIYTRIWDEASESYLFYAIDHDGTLIQCYERGDNIMWLGTQVNTLLWDFTEYYYEGTDDPNFYYELQNEYSKKYLAPQFNGNQALSDNKIGINIPGRRRGDFYSDIMAWDNKYYAYAGLKQDIANDTILPCPKSQADTFYFAIMNPDVDDLEPVATIDNSKYGITMKLIDFPDKVGKGHNIQDQVLGDETVWENHKYEAVKGLLSTGIEGDSKTAFPVAVNTNTSLSELFGNAKPVNHLFIESTYNASGYFEYDSCQNYATLQHRDSGDFLVYKELATADSSSKDSLKHGQFLPYDDIDNGSYATLNKYNLYDAELNLLSNDDPRKYEELYLIKEPDYYLGMDLSASFEQTHSGLDAWGHPMIFEFTGDDDFWLYVDGELVIDLGGIHSALGGKVNFKTGDVEVNGVKTNLRAIYQANYEARNPGASQEEINTFLKKYFAYDEATGVFLNKFKDYSSHTMRIFYMERGAGASNLHMRFNLSYVTPGSVTLKKDVSNDDGTPNEELDFDIVQYPFQIYYKREGSDREYLLDIHDPEVTVKYVGSVQPVDYEEHYSPPGTSKIYDNVFFLNLSKTIEINFPSDTFAYKMVECAVNSQVYKEVRVNGTRLDGEKLPDCIHRLDYTLENEEVEGGWILVSDVSKVTFDNTINPEGMRSLFIKKRLYDESGNEIDATTDKTKFSFRLYLANGETDDDLSSANMVKYRVLDLNGEYCRWNPDTEYFESLGKSDFSKLTPEEKEAATFETSMNGSVSNIRAGYTVEVPNLPVGTKFKVEERDYEVPMGYHLRDYYGDLRTYEKLGDEDNIGKVVEKESPELYIDNDRGWEIKANKVWSDKDFTTYHDPIYTAVFLGNTMVPGTLKQLTGSNPSVRYFIKSKQEGSNFEDYTIKELIVNNPTVDDDGNVTSCDSWEQIDDFISVGATPKGSTEVINYNYQPTYDVGGAEYSYYETDQNHSTGQIRTDTVTNTRQGGLLLDLYKMGTEEPLADGKFVLTDADDNVLGEFTSDDNGRITIMYDFDYNVQYKLTETASPSSYIGLPNTMVFYVDDNKEIHLSGNEEQWQDWERATGENLVAYINVYNKQFSIKVKKFDSVTETPVEGVHFALYKGVTASTGNIRKDYYPLAGYDDIVTDSDGVIAGLDSTITPGKYYLVETQAQDGYVGITGDIEFTFDDNGILTLDKCPPGSNVSLDKKEGTTDDIYEYTIKVPNKNVTGEADLTITKTITGNNADLDKEFTFTFKVEGDNGSTPYVWKKNGVQQDTPIKSGKTFTLKHEQSVVITVPAGSIITISEDTEGYESSFKYNDEEAQAVDGLTFPVIDDTQLSVTNNKDVVIPTGVWMPIAVLLGAGAAFLICLVKLKRRGKRLKRYIKED